MGDIIGSVGTGQCPCPKMPARTSAIRCPEMPTARLLENGHCPLMPVPEKIARAARGQLRACHKYRTSSITSQASIIYFLDSISYFIKLRFLLGKHYGLKKLHFVVNVRAL